MSCKDNTLFNKVPDIEERRDLALNQHDMTGLRFVALGTVPAASEQRSASYMRTDDPTGGNDIEVIRQFFKGFTATDDEAMAQAAWCAESLPHLVRTRAIHTGVTLHV